MSAAEFTYSNRSVRAPGRVVTWASRVLPGVARVQADVAPFADAWQADNRRALESGLPLWVALGDSLTQGIGASAHDRGWVGQLRDRLAEQGREYAVVNLGVSGAVVQDVLDRQVPVLDSLDPALVTLMIGSNDLMNPRHRAGLADRFDRLLSALPRGAVVTTLPNPSRVAAEVNRVIARDAAEHGLVVAELRDPRTSSWRGRLAADHFHPNERGYAAIANVIAGAVGGGLPSAP